MLPSLRFPTAFPDLEGGNGQQSRQFPPTTLMFNEIRVRHLLDGLNCFSALMAGVFVNRHGISLTQIRRAMKGGPHMAVVHGDWYDEERRILRK